MRLLNGGEVITICLVLAPDASSRPRCRLEALPAFSDSDCRSSRLMPSDHSRLRTCPRPMAPGFKALNGINLEINRGEIFALLGPNGAGKTTLISIICGIANPTSGSVTLVDGHDIVTSISRRAIADRPGAAGTAHRRLRIGAGPPSASAAACSASRPTLRISKRCCATCRCGTRRTAKIVTLSGGMKRRVMIAKALSHEPQILFLDEPTAGVDVELRKGTCGKWCGRCRPRASPSS